MSIEAYRNAFIEAKKGFYKTVASYGLPFEDTETSPRSLRNQVQGCCCENSASSLWLNWISPACIACRTGEKSATYFISLQCTQQCYFCFNPNQEDYDYFLQHQRDIATELKEANKRGLEYDFLAITGGEPFLHQKDVLEFLDLAKKLYPKAQTRIYTNGDLLDDTLLQNLKLAALDEIRFSLKPTDVVPQIKQTIKTISKAIRYIPAVVVEMPVLPGTYHEMQDLLITLNSMGVKGINLLEFCFPLHNAEEYRARGFLLRKEPYSILYDYWYAGGIPVASSESVCLALLEFAIQTKLALGIHYCSADNKNSGQIFQQNMAFQENQAIRNGFPFYMWDASDYFIKCAKVFGQEVEYIADFFIKNSYKAGAEFYLDESVPSISFHLEKLDLLHEEFPNIEVNISINVLESDDIGFYLREVDIVSNQSGAIRPC